MSTTTVNFQPQLDKLRSQISELVQQYAEIAHAPKPFVPGVSPVPVSGKVIGTKELQLMVEASLDGWLTTGRFNAMFEKRLADFLGVKYLITVNSGSSANLVAFSALTSPKLGERAIRQGDEVIGVAAGFPDHGQPDPAVRRGAGLRRRGSGHAQHRRQQDRGRHHAEDQGHHAGPQPGQPVQPGRRHRAVQEVQLVVGRGLLRCARRQLQRPVGRHLRRYRHAELLPAHHITMGEGGAVFTNNAELKLIAESFRDWGRDCYCPPGKDNTCDKRFCWTKKELGGDLPDGYDHKYTYSHLGYNLKISDMQAACALAQMDRVEEFISQAPRQFRLSEEPPARLRRVPLPARSHAKLGALVVRLPADPEGGCRCQAFGPDQLP